MDKHRQREQESYGLFTMITMIIGVVVGSGIYFRTDDIVRYANGNLLLGMLILALGSLCIVFGSLTLAELAKRHVATGGIIAFFDQFVSRKVAAGYGWFQLFIWLPSIAVVIGWASALYTFMLLEVEATLFQQIALGFAYNVWFALMNYWSRYLGGAMQRFTTLIKMIPLILIAIYGGIMTPVSNEVATSVQTFGSEVSKFGWLTALLPLIFSYDGWVMSLAIAGEVENPKKNITRALVISPLIILVLYLLYFFGMFNLMGSETILALGDKAIFVVIEQFFGAKMANIMLLIIVISMLGVLNGVNMAGIRIPPVLAEQHIIPDKKFSNKNPRTQTSLHSTLLVIALEGFWSIMHYVVMRYDLFGGRDISEISIVFSYMSYILLYAIVWRIYKEEKKYNKLFIPALAILGSIIILIGSMMASPFYVTIFFVICSTMIFIGSQFYERKAIKKTSK